MVKRRGFCYLGCACLLAALAGPSPGQSGPRTSPDSGAGETLRALRALADPGASEAVLLKRLRHDGAKARWVESHPGFDPGAVAGQVELVQRLAAQRFLAGLYDAAGDAGEPGDGELKRFYREHAERYARPQTATWVQVQLRNNSSETLALARKALLDWIRSDATGGEPAKAETPGFSINLERDQVLRPGHPYLEAVGEAVPGDIYGPFSPAGSPAQAMIAVLELVPGGIVPFDEVRERVHSDLFAHRSARVERRLEQAAEARHPIRFGNRYLNYKELDNTRLQGSSWGSVGDLVIDDDFLGAVQLIYPRFFFSPQAAAFRANLRRYYVFPRVKAKWLAELDPDLVRRQAHTLETLRSIARDRYLASRWSALAREEVAVTEEDAHAYYKDHPGEFILSGKASFLMAVLAEADEYTVQRAREALERQARRGNQSVDLKQDHDGFNIVFVEDLEARRNPRLYDAVADRKRGIPHGPVTLPSSQKSIVVLITEAVPPGRRAYESVRDICIQRLEQARLAELEARMLEPALRFGQQGVP